jgi:hypothetical protein
MGDPRHRPADGPLVEDDLSRVGHLPPRKSPPGRNREGFRTSETRTWRGSPDRPFLTSQGQMVSSIAAWFSAHLVS